VEVEVLEVEERPLIPDSTWVLILGLGGVVEVEVEVMDVGMVVMVVDKAGMDSASASVPGVGVAMPMVVPLAAVVVAVDGLVKVDLANIRP
jgi:hypothetical protein